MIDPGFDVTQPDAKDLVSRVEIDAQQREDNSWVIRVRNTTTRSGVGEWTEMPPLPHYDAAMAAVGLLARMLRGDIATKLSDRLDYAGKLAGKVMEAMP